MLMCSKTQYCYLSVFPKLIYIKAISVKSFNRFFFSRNWQDDLNLKKNTDKQTHTLLHISKQEKKIKDRIYIKSRLTMKVQ